MSFRKIHRGSRAHSHSKGFTLIEILVTIAIIVLLSSVILTSLANAREKARIARATTFAGHVYGGYGAFLTPGNSPVGGLWLFNDVNNPGTDSSGNNNNGALNGSASQTSDTPNNNGHSISFDGSVAYMSIPDPNGKLNLTNGTIGAWIKMPTTDPLNGANGNGWQMIVGKISSTLACSYKLAVQNSYLAVWDCPAQKETSDVNNYLADGKWHYVAFSFKSGVSGGSQLYLDGSLDGSAFSYNAGSAANATVFIGGAGSGLGENFNGDLNDVAIYPEALTMSQVEKIYASGLPEHSLASAK